VTAASSAKFALAQIDERQNKLTDAMNLYEDIMHNNPNSTLASERVARDGIENEAPSAPPSPLRRLRSRQTTEP